MKQVTINVGFITNSSSVVHYFDHRVMEDPEVQAILTAYGVENGYVGSNLWHRGECETLAISKAQKQAIHAQMTDNEYSAYGPKVDPEKEDEVVVIYGDEYPGLTSELCEVMVRAAKRRKLSHWNTEYN